MDSFFGHPDAYPVLAVCATGLTLAIIFASHYWYKLRRAEMELGLKQAMIERGMSAEEICAVIESGHDSKPEVEGKARPAKYFKVKA